MSTPDRKAARFLELLAVLVEQEERRDDFDATGSPV
jgi:hypothetical protein